MASSKNSNEHQKSNWESKNSNEHQKSNWDDMAIEDSASDLEDSWAGEEVMFDGSPSSGIEFLFFWLRAAPAS